MLEYAGRRFGYGKTSMQIKHLSLTNFRNFGRLELDLPAGATLLYGANAQGKTNLLEAIYYLATTRSPHTSQDHELINWDAGQYGEPVVVGRLVAHLQTSDGMRHLEMRLIREEANGQSSFRREALVDRRKVRLMDLLGNLRVVLFIPQDVNLIAGPPSGRRRYVDITLCQSDQMYCRTLSQYNKVLEQRNALLRQLAEQPAASRKQDVLSVFTDRLTQLGTAIFVRRARFLEGLAREVQRIHYELLTGGHESLRMHYAPCIDQIDDDGDGGTEASGQWLLEHVDQPQQLRDHFRDQLQRAFSYELGRGATTIGPHRDEWSFSINGRSLRSYGSRGQQRSAILALKMGEIQWITRETGDLPLLLLDDVMAELDGVRRELLLSALGDAGQALITTTDAAIFPEEFLQRAHTLEVKSGRISPVAVSLNN